MKGVKGCMGHYSYSCTCITSLQNTLHYDVTQCILLIFFSACYSQSQVMFSSCLQQEDLLRINYATDLNMPIIQIDFLDLLLPGVCSVHFLPILCIPAAV